MRHDVLALLATALASFCPGPARAEEVDFGYSYGAEITEAGETEAELWVTDRRGKGEGHYDAQDYKLEIEHGFSDRFGASIYANLASHHIRGLEPRFENIDRDFGFQGVSAEFKYNVLKPAGHNIGVTFYVEPGWSRIHKIEGGKVTEYELELKAIVQKNFLDDRLVWVGNLTFEPEWGRETEELAPRGVEKHWERELKIEATTGLAYAVAPRWSLGVEGRYSSEYPDWTNGLHREGYAVSAGPTVHYSAAKWGITATYLPQVFGSPGRGGSDLELDDHEKQEFRVKVGYEF